jgi:RNA-binding protein NOB1
MNFAAAAAAAAAKADTAPDAGPSKPASGIQHLILDAGPLLSMTPLRHQAQVFHTTPAVLAELRDPRAREHWDRLALQGVDVRVAPPSAEAVAAVTAFAKKTGDYNVLSSTDLGVIALTWQWEVAVNGKEWVRTTPGQVLPPRPGQEKKDEKKEAKDDDEDSSDGEEVEAPPAESGDAVEEVARGVEALSTEPDAPVEKAAEPAAEEKPAADDKAAAAAAAWGDDDGEGEWITPTNVKKHRNRDLGLLPSASGTVVPLAAAAMTGDYAVQNVLLGMGLGLVGEGGKRISRVKSYVLRCHACFKLCKDSSKRFCPSCGNATLLRATVTTSSVTGKQTIHLKKNFQYRTRGTKYSIPAPTPGSAKGQKKAGSGLILREDQAEWQDAVRAGERERRREEKKIIKGDGNWMDPDVSRPC